MKPTILLAFLTLFPFSYGDAVAVDYTTEIRPILNKKCYKCHSGPRAKGKLRMDSQDSLSKRIGGDDPAIIPGNPANSLLTIKAGLPRTDGDAMPPPPARARGAEGMTSVELNLVKRWIAEGAKFSADDPDPAPETTATATATATELLDWNNTKGVSLKAFFVAVNATHVKLRKDDGSEFVYPLANLDAASQAQAKKLGAQ
ncbi:MAG: hypothetical protein CMO61_09975 [Verrucomicrobiales bacterium]|jgi:hypothetical protein|nr:hypothetical protein [Verrucomicrobiales bacterium]